MLEAGISASAGVKVLVVAFGAEYAGVVKSLSVIVGNKGGVLVEVTVAMVNVLAERKGSFV